MLGLIGAATAVFARTTTDVRGARQTAGVGSLNVCMLLSISTLLQCALKGRIDLTIKKVN